MDMAGLNKQRDTGESHGVGPIIISLLDPPKTVIVKETGKEYKLVVTQNNKVMLQAPK